MNNCTPKECKQPDASWFEEWRRKRPTKPAAEFVGDYKLLAAVGPGFLSLKLQSVSPRGSTALERLYEAFVHDRLEIKTEVNWLYLSQDGQVLAAIPLLLLDPNDGVTAAQRDNFAQNGLTAKFAATDKQVWLMNPERNHEMEIVGLRIEGFGLSGHNQPGKTPANVFLNR